MKEANSMQMGFTTITCFIFWRETYAPVILGRKAARLRKETGNTMLRTKYDTGMSARENFMSAIGRVLKILLYSPIVLALAIYVGLASSYFYLLFTTLTPIYESVYHFSASISGLSYIGVGIGFMLGQATFSFGSDRILRRLAARKNNAEMKPEYRLAPSVLGGILSPIGLFWYGWTVEAQVHWIVPMIGSSLIGLGNSLTFVRHSILLPPNPNF
jgi:Major Facilitator Superfamily